MLRQDPLEGTEPCPAGSIRWIDRRLRDRSVVGRDGSIDWLCWPAFDSDACFADLLGTHRNGRWMIRPAEEVTSSSRRYRENTLILETRFETAGGEVVLIDFMPPRGHASDVVRLGGGCAGGSGFRCNS